MSRDLEPIIGNWYRHLDKGQMFRVVAFDDSDSTVELQHFDGDIEEVGMVAWRSTDLEVTAAPEDWTGPMDDIEPDDLGYSSEIVMSEEDWRAPLQEVRRDPREAWEETGRQEGSAGRDEESPTEELWDPQRIESLDENSFTWLEWI